MQYSNTASNGIVEGINFTCNLASADTTEFPLVDKQRSINDWQDSVVIEILDSMDEWDFQGAKAYSNLVANQQAYPWPTDILKIKRVEVDYDEDGNYVVAEPFDSSTYEGTIATSAEINKIFSKNSPKYDAFANSAFLYPVADTAVNSGLIVLHENRVVQFSSMSTGFTTSVVGNSAEPAFDRAFHKILVVGSSLDFGHRRQIDSLIAYCERELYAPKKGLFDRLRRFYGSRTADKKMRVGVRYFKENYN